MKWASFVVAAAASAAGEKVTPIQKVISMLEEMAARGKKERHEEQVQFATYKQFCEDTARDKTRSIEKANEDIEKYKADMEKFAADAKRLGKEVAANEAAVANLEGDLSAAKKVRDMEHGTFQKEHQDYNESIKAIKGAIQVLEAQTHNRAQKGETEAANSALLQIQDLIPADQKPVITAFLAADPGTASLAQLTDSQAPTVAAYEFQSGGVIDMLEKLRTKFADERDTLLKEEANSKHAYDMFRQEATMEKETREKAIERDSAEKAKKLQAAADAKGNLQDTTTTRDTDQKYLDDLKAECSTKASQFKVRQQLRADEISAIEEATKIISSNAVKGSGEKHLPQLVQTSFLQLNTRTEMSNDAAQKRVMAFLNQAAEKKHSQVLMQVAAAAGADPFEKVKGLIQSLITRLKEEAAEEAEKNGWCKTELAKNKKTREAKEDAVETLSAEIESLEASISKTTDVLAELADSIQSLEKAMAEATDMRNKEHEKNTTTIDEAKQAQAAVAQALTVLRDFYAKAGTSEAFLQQQPEAPEIFDEPYTGMQDVKGGVVGMLEVIESDFARLEADTTADEESAQKEYDQFMGDSKTDKKVKETQTEHNQAKKQNEQQALQEKKEDLTSNQNQLDAANREFEKLKPTCIDTGVSHEERMAKRQEEVESLQEALKILEQEQL